MTHPTSSFSIPKLTILLMKTWVRSNGLKVYFIGFHLIVILSLLGSPSLLASLGGARSSIQEDQGALQGEIKVLPRQGYTVHKIISQGMKIQEYTLPNGTVFAVSWRGMTEPDLSVILGNYYQDYKEAADQSKRTVGRGRRTIHNRHLVVEKFGHMRDVRGIAYIPQLVPPGLHIENIH